MSCVSIAVGTNLLLVGTRPILFLTGHAVGNSPKLPLQILRNRRYALLAAFLFGAARDQSGSCLKRLMLPWSCSMLSSGDITSHSAQWLGGECARSENSDSDVASAFGISVASSLQISLGLLGYSPGGVLSKQRAVHVHNRASNIAAYKLATARSVSVQDQLSDADLPRQHALRLRCSPYLHGGLTRVSFYYGILQTAIIIPCHFEYCLCLGRPRPLGLHAPSRQEELLHCF